VTNGTEQGGLIAERAIMSARNSSKMKDRGGGR
jgi:hypothetical protein